jgi:Transmembrane exosortase (Exosortase_EpsH).
MIRIINKPGWLYLLYGIMAWWALQQYLNIQSVNVILGIVALPIVMTVQRDHKGSSRYGWIALCFALASIWLPVKTLLFFTIVFACFFITETFTGKLNLLPVLAAGLMSPLFQYVSNVVSFPLRLRITGMAGACMNAIGLKTAVAGNMILYNGSEFSVDPACMGLNMLAVCLLLQLMLVAVFQKQQGVQVKVWVVLALLAAALFMNVVSNLFRIISLVWLNILPGTVMHDIVGLFCLMLYVVLPMIVVTRWAVARFGTVPVNTAVGSKKPWVVHVLLLMSTCYAAFTIAQHANKNNGAAVPVVDGYRATRIDAEIVKLENEQSLVYIKRIPGFYNADHHPMICWKGSGYAFNKVKKQGLVYTAVLQNGPDRLYTAWWYDNGSSRTTEQMSWRWDMMKGAPNYSLVNVTAASEWQLQQIINSLMKQHTLKPALQ